MLHLKKAGEGGYYKKKVDSRWGVHQNREARLQQTRSGKRPEWMRKPTDDFPIVEWKAPGAT